MANYRFPSGPAWSFKAGRFAVYLYVTHDHRYKYDGEDEDGETQAALDCGDYVAFDSRVVVELDGEEIGVDYLGGSVYQADQVSDFWTDHRSSDPMNRNCEAMRATHGGNAVICHYFPDMVRSAIKEARSHVRDMRPVPYIRESAQ